ARVRGVRGLGRGHRSAARALPVRPRLSLLRAEPEMREPQRDARQGRRLDAPLSIARGRRLVLLRLAPYAVLAGLVALLLWLFVCVGTSHPKHADAIVVLAGNPGRVTTGERLHAEGVAPVLALSVDEMTNVKTTPMCRASRVFCFHASPFSTRGEAETFSRI